MSVCMFECIYVCLLICVCISVAPIVTADCHNLLSTPYTHIKQTTCRAQRTATCTAPYSNIPYCMPTNANPRYACESVHMFIRVFARKYIQRTCRMVWHCTVTLYLLYRYVQVLTYMYICVYIYVYDHVCIYICTYIYVCTLIYIDIYIYISIYIRICVWISIYIHIYI